MYGVILHVNVISNPCTKANSQKQHINVSIITWFHLQRRLSWKFRITDRFDTHNPHSKGVVEVFMRDKWRTICSDGWEIDDARVACGAAGFPDVISIRPNE